MNHLTMDDLIKASDSLHQLGEIKPRLSDMKIYTSKALVKTRQIRFPRSKRKRIRKKWRKRWTRTIPDEFVYFAKSQGAILCHPEMYEKLKLQLKA